MSCEDEVMRITRKLEKISKGEKSVTVLLSEQLYNLFVDGRSDASVADTCQTTNYHRSSHGLLFLFDCIFIVFCRKLVSV